MHASVALIGQGLELTHEGAFEAWHEEKQKNRTRIESEHRFFGDSVCVVYSLGTLLMALRGLSTRTALMAEKLMLWRSREYSTNLRNTNIQKITVIV